MPYSLALVVLCTIESVLDREIFIFSVYKNTISPNHKVLNVLEKLLIHNKRPSLRTLEILADLYKIEVTLLEQWFHVQIMLKIKLQITNQEEKLELTNSKKVKAV